MFLSPLMEAQAQALAQREVELEAKARALAEKEAELERVSAELGVSRMAVRESEAALRQASAENGMLRGTVEQMKDFSQLPVGVLDARRYRNAPPLDFYDAVLTISNLEDVYIPDRGWQVKVTQKRPFDFSSPRPGVRVIPLGHFNSGKTWLIDQLSGAELPKGATVHTQGISIKEATADELKIILLDTVGSNSPMDSLPNGVDARQASNGAEAMLQELRVQEDFYRQVCFELGQVIVLVVGQMSHKDQMDLLRLAREIRKDRVRKDILVVHNLRDWDMEMLLQKSEKDDMTYTERTQVLFGLEDGSLAVTLGAETKKVIRHTGLYPGEGGQESAVNVYHYYLTDHRLPCSCNNFAIADMKAVVTRNARGSTSLAEDFAIAATKIQTRFASFTVDEPEIIFDAETSRFRVRDPIPDGAYRMKPRDLGAYFMVGSDEQAYNITLTPVVIETYTDYDDTPEKQGRKAYQLQIELPALCAASLAEIKAQFRRRDGSGAWRWEDNEQGQQLTISFQARLLNVPEGLPDEVAEATKSKVEVSKEVAQYDVADRGSRQHFREGVRTVKVTLRTGIKNYDTNKLPIVTYIDGVLGITLIQQPVP